MLDWTGERFIPVDVGVQVTYEHYSRYLFAQNFCKDKSVLDCPSGEGFGSYLISTVASSVVGIDVSEDAVAHGREKYHRDNLKFTVGDMGNLSEIASESLDVVLCFEGIEHVGEQIQAKALSEFFRVLKNDGTLLISTPNKKVYSDIPGYSNAYHVREFYEEEFISFVKSKFSSVHMYGQSVVNACLLQPIMPIENYVDSKAYVSHTEPGLKISSLTDTWMYFVAVARKTGSSQPAVGLNLVDFGRGLEEEIRGESIRRLHQLHQEAHLMREEISKLKRMYGLGAVLEKGKQIASKIKRRLMK